MKVDWENMSVLLGVYDDYFIISNKLLLEVYQWVITEVKILIYD